MWLDAGDVSRTRLVPALHPLGSAVIGSQLLRRPEAEAALPGLRTRHERAARDTAVLHHLVPAAGYIPDFLTPVAGGESVDAGIEEMRRTGRERLRVETRQAYAHLPATPLRRRLAAGDPEIIDALAGALRGYFDAVLAPGWPVLTRLIQAEVAHRAATLATSGLGALLAGLHPGIRWHAPVLEVDTWWDGEATPGGHGVLLVPSPFTGPKPRVMASPGGPALLVYPVATPAAVAGPRADSLRSLLGRTRADVLRHLATPGRHTTAGLAGALGISPASASEHAAALRAAGLVATNRVGRSAVHVLTPLGSGVLRAS